MADSLPTYSAREVAVAWGIVNFEGFSSDNIVTLMYNTDLTTETIGADGKLATSVTPDRSGTVKIELMQTSISNITMSAILAAQNNSTNTSEIVKQDFAVSDPSGSVLCIARNAYLKTAPEISLGVDQATREWTLYSEKIDFLPIPRGVEDAEITAEVTATVLAMFALSGL